MISIVVAHNTGRTHTPSRGKLAIPARRPVLCVGQHCLPSTPRRRRQKQPAILVVTVIVRLPSGLHIVDQIVPQGVIVVAAGQAVSVVINKIDLRGAIGDERTPRIPPGVVDGHFKVADNDAGNAQGQCDDPRHGKPSASEPRHVRSALSGPVFGRVQLLGG